jgi:hypothetical protein
MTMNESQGASPAGEECCYVLTLKPLTGAWRVPPWQRLRAALKRLSRDYGLRCVECRPTPIKKAPAAQNRAIFGQSHMKKDNENNEISKPSQT